MRFTRKTHKYQDRNRSSIVIDPRIFAGAGVALAKTLGGTARTRKHTKSHWESDDFHSNNGIMTTIWGPPTWHLLHCISFNYPVEPTAEEKKQYYTFVKQLRHVLPCGKCRKNLVKNFQKLPFERKHMASRDTFSRYIYDLHEVINDMLGKTSNLTYEEVRDTYEHFRARCAPVGGSIKKETGCVVPFNGRKKRCVLEIKSM